MNQKLKNMKKTDKKEMFIRFLKEEGSDVYRSFIYNFNDQKWFRQCGENKCLKTFEQYFGKTKIRSYLNDAFFWSNTNEGYWFWKKLDDKWTKICYRKNIKCVVIN